MPGFDLRLRAYAEVIIQVGLNLQPGQHLLVAEPYELQGVARSADVIVNAIRSAATEAGLCTAGMIDVIWGDGGRLREFAAKKDWRGLTRLVADNAHKMNDHVQHGGALLFLVGSEPGLMEGVAPSQVADARRIGNEYFGGVVQQLMQGATNWTAVPAPSSGWADSVYADLPLDRRAAALWETVFEATRVPPGDPADGNSAAEKCRSRALASWEHHLRKLKKRRDELNAQRFGSLRYRGDRTDLTVTLPPEHLWCTANLRTKSGIPFVANLPTEEIFTLPHKDSAKGVAHIARPIAFGGSIIDGIELEFAEGRVVKATAQKGEALLHQLLDTDAGSSRLGEVALAAGELHEGDSSGENDSPSWSRGRFFHHTLLDENAGSHVAIGEGYGFCQRTPDTGALNHSLIHVDLPIAATANLLP